MDPIDIQAVESKLSDVTVTAIPLAPKAAQNMQPGQPKYAQLLAVIEEISREIRPTYAGSRSAGERLKRAIIHSRMLVRECLIETERSARQ